MSDKIVTLQDENQNNLYPTTSYNAVKDANGAILPSDFTTIGQGSSTTVKVDGTSITSNNEADLKTINGNYNASTNKLATASDIPSTSSLVSDVSYDSTNKKLKQTKGSSTTDVVTFGSNAFTNTAIPTSDSDLTNDRYVRYDTSSQGLNSTQQSNARTNIGAGTSNFSGSYTDLSDKPTIPDGITEISSQYIRITDLATGVYKLTYNGTKYIYYNGSTSTSTHTVTSGSASTILVVNRYSTTRWNWYYINSSSGSGTIYFGGTSTSSGSNNSKILANLLTSYTETDPVFSASAAAGITSTNITNWNNSRIDSLGTGYIRFTNGLQICWGELTTTSSSGGSVEKAFAKAFKSSGNDIQIVASKRTNSTTNDTWRGAGYTSFTNTSITAIAASGAPKSYIAIGLWQ